MITSTPAFCRNPFVLRSGAAEGYFRIAAVLLSMFEDKPVTPRSTSDKSLAPCKGTEKLERYLDSIVLQKLRFRWMAATLTSHGQRARQMWMSKYQPPNISQDDRWLTFPGFRELCRRVLGLHQTEVSNDELELLFDSLDLEDNGRVSFYKLVGYLEANTHHDHGLVLQSRRKSRPRSPSKLRGLPVWRPPGRDFRC